MLLKSSIFFKKSFINVSSSLNFPISRKHHNLELIVIRYDVGHSVYMVVGDYINIMKTAFDINLIYIKLLNNMDTQNM